MSRGERNMDVPPSCAIPASNDTRVRVEDLSKIIASILPRSGAWCSPLLAAALSAIARCNNCINSSRSRSNRVRKCRGLMSAAQSP